MPSPTTKPAIVLVPGAWHDGPSAFAPLTSLLQSAGYEVSPVSLPSVGADPPLQNWDPDVDAIRSAVASAVDEGKDVVVMVHSYGGLPAGEAVRGLEKKEGGAGVVRLVYCCAFFMEEGGYLMKGLGDQPLPWFDVQGDYIYPLRPEEIFYNDLDDATVSKLKAQLKPHSYKTFWSKVTYPAYKHIPSTYIICEKDNAIPLHAQEGMLAGAGVEFTVERCGASHTPFWSMPEFVAGCLRRAAGEVDV